MRDFPFVDQSSWANAIGFDYADYQAGNIRESTLALIDSPNLERENPCFNQ
jgi:hypothetical protein